MNHEHHFVVFFRVYTVTVIILKLSRLFGVALFLCKFLCDYALDRQRNKSLESTGRCIMQLLRVVLCTQIKDSFGLLGMTK